MKIQCIEINESWQCCCYWRVEVGETRVRHLAEERSGCSEWPDQGGVTEARDGAELQPVFGHGCSPDENHLPSLAWRRTCHDQVHCTCNTELGRERNRRVNHWGQEGRALGGDNEGVARGGGQEGSVHREGRGGEESRAQNHVMLYKIVSEYIASDCHILTFWVSVTVI